MARRCRRAAYGVMRSLVKLRREGRQALIRNVVRRIQQPTLIVWGERDRGMPLDHAVRLEQSIFDARLVTLPDCAHCPPVEAPDAVVAALEQFMATPSARIPGSVSPFIAEDALAAARQDG